MKPTEISKLIKDIDKIEIKPSMIQPTKEIKSIGKFQVKYLYILKLTQKLPLMLLLPRLYNNYTIFSPIIFFHFLKSNLLYLLNMENNLSIIQNQFQEPPNNIEAEQRVIDLFLLRMTFSRDKYYN